MKRVVQLAVLIAVSAAPAYAGRVVTTTPEPMSLGLIATGVAVLGAGAWFKNRKR